MAEPFNPDPKQRGFARLQRCPDSHQLDDDELAKIIFNATEAPAGAFRAQGSPLGETQNYFHRSYADL